MDCETYLPTPNNSHPCSYDAWLAVEKKQKLLLNDWFENAWKMREQPVEEHRRGLLQAWDLLRMIGNITTGSMDDSHWVPALISSNEFQEIYERVLAEKKSLMRMYARRFTEVWPVYDSVSLRKAGLTPSAQPTREDVVFDYCQHDSAIFRPACWITHRKENNQPLPDWHHILPAWQTAAVNLLDPSGWYETETDLRIITNAFMSLIYFFKEGKVFFENPSLRPDIFDRTQVLSSL